MKAAGKTRAAWGDLLVAALILIMAVFSALALRPGETAALTAEVRVDGELVLSQRLDDLEQPRLVTLEGEYPLVLEISREGVRVTQSDCPGKDCVHTGIVREQGRQLICLPNRTVVTLQGGSSIYDAITG